MSKKVVVIGGGLAGTSAARALTARGYAVTILEKNNYLGGRIHSHVLDGAAVEMGAGFMTRLYANVHEFLLASGLSDRLYQQHGSSGMVRGGRVYMTDLHTMLGSDALSWSAKRQALRLLGKTLARWQHLDHHAFWKADRYDIRSVKDIFPENQQEVVEYLLQPLLNGYFYWSPEHVSEAMLVCLVKAAIGQGGSYKMQGGLQRIPERAAQGSTVVLGCEVKQVSVSNDATYKLAVTQDGQQKILSADGIVCATTASAVPALLREQLTKQQQDFFAAIKYSSTAVLARTYKPDQVRSDKGIAFPRREGSILSAVTVSPEPGDRGRVANVKVFASGEVGSQLCSEQEETIAAKLAAAMESIRDYVFVEAPEPLATHIQRWPEALPYFDVGHFKRLRAFEKGEIENPNQTLVFAGDYLDGPFMEGAFTSGMKAAERLMQRLG